MEILEINYIIPLILCFMAFALAIFKRDGWGWFLFAALILFGAFNV